jgi:CheY-like chemotaxis protein
VIDDEPLIRDIVKKILLDAGYHVRTAEHGREALDLLQKSQFDLIISDLNMPHMDGKEFIIEFRRTNATTPLVIITGTYFQDQDLEASVETILKKPFSAPVLLKTVEAIFSRISINVRR